MPFAIFEKKTGEQLRIKPDIYDETNYYVLTKDIDAPLYMVDKIEDAINTVHFKIPSYASSSNTPSHDYKPEELVVKEVVVSFKDVEYFPPIIIHYIIHVHDAKMTEKGEPCVYAYVLNRTQQTFEELKSYIGKRVFFNDVPNTHRILLNVEQINDENTKCAFKLTCTQLKY